MTLSNSTRNTRNDYIRVVLIANTVFVLVFDLAVFVLTLLKTVRQVWEARRMGMSVTYSYVLLRDG